MTTTSETPKKVIAVTVTPIESPKKLIAVTTKIESTPTRVVVTKIEPTPITVEPTEPAEPGKFQVLPPLAPDDFELLKADIDANGVQVAVEYDEDGNILDGHHRVRACKELGIDEWPRVVRTGLTEAKKRNHARSLNLARRHLTRDQKRELIAAQLVDTPECSARQIATGLGVDHKTVASVREDLVATGEIPQLEKTTGKDGKARLASKPKTASKPKAKGKPKVPLSAAPAKTVTTVERSIETPTSPAAKTPQVVADFLALLRRTGDDLAEFDARTLKAALGKDDRL
jgi:ParB-like chromosome segregation protein Spo0J